MSFRTTASLVNASALSFFIINAEYFRPPPVYVHPPEPLNNSLRLSSYPYISGDSFRKLAHFFVDELRLPINPLEIKEGDIIFVKSQLISYFFTILHPRIQSHYILITHNDDNHSPNSFAHMLDDEKLIAWFAQNPDIHYHPKFFPIPIGLSNQYWPMGNLKIINEVLPHLTSIQKTKLCYLNYTIGTNLAQRQTVYDLFKNKSFCFIFSGRKPWKEYLLDLAQSKFVLSPHGNGLDCCRTWESLYMGSIPIVKTSTLDSLYEDLPVLIVNDWNEITEEFLREKWFEMQQKFYQKEKIFVQYWLDQILTVRKNFLNKKESL